MSQGAAPKASGGWHAFAIGVIETIALHVVQAIGNQLVHQGNQIVGVHLIVPGHDAEDVIAVAQSPLVTRDDGASDSAIVAVAEGVHAGIGAALRYREGAIRARVVDDVNSVDECGNGRQRGVEQRLFAVGGDHDCDSLILPHVRGIAAPIASRKRVWEGAAVSGRGARIFSALRRNPGIFVAGSLRLLALVGLLAEWDRYPSDRTPEGAYLRIVSGVNRGQPQELFAYIELGAQHACFSISDYRRRSQKLVERDYPPALRAAVLLPYQAEAATTDGPELFEVYARNHAWIERLSRDLSGIAEVVVEGERATIVPARGTRYPFRRRPNGIWGLTWFTATLQLDAEKAARDYSLIESSAADYRRTRSAVSDGGGAQPRAVAP